MTTSQTLTIVNNRPTSSPVTRPVNDVELLKTKPTLSLRQTEGVITVWNAFDAIMNCVTYGASFPVDVPLQYNGTLQTTSPSGVTKFGISSLLSSWNV